MIKILLLAVVPFMTQHRNVVPKTEVSTNFYGSVTGIVDKAYIEARVGVGGGGCCDTNAVDILANSAVVTNALTVATTNRVALLESSKADKSALAAHVANTDNPHAVTAAQVGAVPLVEDANGEKTAVTIGSRKDGSSIGIHSIADGLTVTASGEHSHAEGGSTTASAYGSHSEGFDTTASGEGSHAEGDSTSATEKCSHTEGLFTGTYGIGSHAEGGYATASGLCAHAEGFNTNASGEYSHAEGDTTESGGKLSHAEGSNAGAVGDYSHAEGSHTTASGIGSHAEGSYTIASGEGSHAEGNGTTASGEGSHAEGASATASGNFSHAEGVMSQTLSGHNFAYVWNGDAEREAPYDSHGAGTFNINPAGGLNGFWIGEQTLFSILTNKANKADISAENPTFSNAVLAVGLNIDTNSVAVLNEIAETFGGFPIGGTATTVGGLLAALAAAVAWLKKNKVGSFASVGGASATVENGVAKLSGFFTESNSLLNGRLSYSRNATGLKDRAFNTLSFDGTEFNLSTALAAVTPTASGQPRDLLIVATATAATTIGYTAGTIKGDKPTIDGAGTWLITLTEYAANTWYCRQIKMEDAA